VVQLLMHVCVRCHVQVHVEDLLLMSININIFGAPKVSLSSSTHLGAGVLRACNYL
jgi:hypothetical protein